MANVHYHAIHDRLDELLFEVRLHASAITALQRDTGELEAAVRELRRHTLEDLDLDQAHQRNGRRVERET